jgi:Ca2+-binding RTX toxin-like protein
MIRDSDNAVVSRHFNPLSGWSGIRVEVSAAHGGHHAWPNVLRAARGRLRFVVREGSMGSTRSGVVAVDRAAARGPDCTKRGTNGNNTLVGTPGRDILCGNGGNDVLRGLGGRDVLLGGKGRDSLNGGPGKDYLDGGAGFDHCSREPGGTRISCERRL